MASTPLYLYGRKVGDVLNVLLNPHSKQPNVMVDASPLCFSLKRCIIGVFRRDLMFSRNAFLPGFFFEFIVSSTLVKRRSWHSAQGMVRCTNLPKFPICTKRYPSVASRKGSVQSSPLSESSSESLPSV